MNGYRLLGAGLVVSVLIHGTGSAMFADNNDDIEIAASKGGGVSVIGSIEDLVAGSKVETVAAEKTLEVIEPETPLSQPIKPPVETTVVQPVKVVQPVTLQETTVVEAAAVPVVEGVTTTEAVTASMLPVNVKPEESKPVIEPLQPVEAVKQDLAEPAPVAPKPVVEQVRPKTQPTDRVEPQKPIEIARAVEPDVTPPLEAIQPQPDVLQPVTTPLQEVTQTPQVKPKPPVNKVEKKRVKKKVAKKSQKKGAEANSRKGGERVTSRTARSNANGRADARTNDGGTQAKSNYRGKVVAKLRRAKRYPKQARRDKLTGTARVSFTISKNGTVSGIRLSRSSGYAALDQAALDMVRRASPMPKFPKGIRLAKMTLQVPVRFDRR